MMPRMLDEPPCADDVAHRYVRGLQAAGVRAMIANVGTRLMAVESHGRLLPVTIDDGGAGDSYVCQPHSAYALYARRELDLVDVGWLRGPSIAATWVLDRVLRAANVNRIVTIDNWLLSTNLHGDWTGEDLGDLRGLLAGRYPDHFLALRTLDSWSSPQLLQAARDDGWILVPARQVWIVDDLATDWLPRRDRTNDRRALARSGLAVEDLTAMDDATAARIAELYWLLYVGRYSPLNPIFTAAFVQLTHAIGLIRYRVARAADGTILSVIGMLERAGVVTCPIVGYDTRRPQGEALYRIACYLASETALQCGWRLHGSAGAAAFKRNRGARAVIEYMAFHAAHLSSARRLAMAGLASVFERWVVPVMQRRRL